MKPDNGSNYPNISRPRLRTSNRFVTASTNSDGPPQNSETSDRYYAQNDWTKRMKSMTELKAELKSHERYGLHSQSGQAFSKNSLGVQRLSSASVGATTQCPTTRATANRTPIPFSDGSKRLTSSDAQFNRSPLERPQPERTQFRLHPVLDYQTRRDVDLTGLDIPTGSCSLQSEWLVATI